MGMANLAKIFGPTVLGYSSANPDQHSIFMETMIQKDVSNSNHLFNFHFFCGKNKMLFKIYDISIGNASFADNSNRLLGTFHYR